MLPTRVWSFPSFSVFLAFSLLNFWGPAVLTLLGDGKAGRTHVLFLLPFAAAEGEH